MMVKKWSRCHHSSSTDPLSVRCVRIPYLHFSFPCCLLGCQSEVKCHTRPTRSLEKLTGFLDVVASKGCMQGSAAVQFILWLPAALPFPFLATSTTVQPTHSLPSSNDILLSFSFAGERRRVEVYFFRLQPTSPENNPQ